MMSDTEKIVAAKKIGLANFRNACAAYDVYHQAENQ